MALAKNSMEGKAEGFLGRIENLLDEIEKAKSAYMNECKERRQDIRDIYAEAKDAGVNVKALRGLVKHREMAAKLEAIPDGFEEDEREAYETLVAALGPLGAAAAKAAGYGNGEEDRDLRPSNLRNDEGRKDEDQLAKVGRGAAVDSLVN